MDIWSQCPISIKFKIPESTHKTRKILLIHQSDHLISIALDDKTDHRNKSLIWHTQICFVARVMTAPLNLTTNRSVLSRINSMFSVVKIWYNKLVNTEAIMIKRLLGQIFMNVVDRAALTDCAPWAISYKARYKTYSIRNFIG